MSFTRTTISNPHGFPGSRVSCPRREVILEKDTSAGGFRTRTFNVVTGMIGEPTGDWAEHRRKGKLRAPSRSADGLRAYLFYPTYSSLLSPTSHYRVSGACLAFLQPASSSRAVEVEGC